MSCLTRRALALVFSCSTLAANAQTAGDPVGQADAESVDSCVLRVIRSAPADATAGNIRSQCEAGLEPDTIVGAAPQKSLIEQRLLRERRTQLSRSVLTPHKRNYLLPVSYMHSPNDKPFVAAGVGSGNADALNNFEAAFQISLKVPLVNNLILREDQLQIGFTTVSFWQAYSKSISAPFRETNYEPEVFWTAPLKWKPFGVDATVLQLGLSHQSNGRSGTLSRSWNRVYANFAWERDRFVFSLKPWWRIPEDPKTDPDDSEGDDNPDIQKYLGNFEFRTVYRAEANELSLLLRNNLRADNKTTVRLDWTFPLWRDIRGYAQYFNGYGESLIDYDVRMQRIGVGILLTDLL